MAHGSWHHISTSKQRAYLAYTQRMMRTYAPVHKRNVRMYIQCTSFHKRHPTWEGPRGKHRRGGDKHDEEAE